MLLFLWYVIFPSVEASPLRSFCQMPIRVSLWRCAPAGNVTPQHLLPYESELGATVTMDRLIVHVCDMEKRPSIPRDWEQLAQVSSRRPARLWLCVVEWLVVLNGWRAVYDFTNWTFHNFQGSALQEILIDCWDCDPEARLTARCVANRLVSLQSCTSVSMRHLHCSQCVTTV